MAQKDKDLLLKDLCGRIMYGVKCTVYEDASVYTLSGVLPDYIYKELYFGELDWKECDGFADVQYCKPYLFPLSSMTEEQKQEYTYIVNYISSDDTENWKEGEFIYVEQFTQLMHFYHINHLDYMGLIPMGLAIDATGKNIY